MPSHRPALSSPATASSPRLSWRCRKSTRLVFVAFDLLYLNGYDLRKLPLTERKAVLKKTIHGTDIQFSESFEVDGGEMTNIVRSGRHVSKVPCVDGCAGRPAKGRRWKSVTVKE